MINLFDSITKGHQAFEAEDRARHAVVQRELTDLQQGIIRDSEGITYTDRFKDNMRKGDDIARSQRIGEDIRRENMEAVEQQLIQMQHKSNAQGLDTIVEHLYSGNANDANKVLAGDPVLKKAVGDAYDIKSIHHVDWDNDIELMRKEGLNIPASILADPVARMALDAQFYKTIDSNGVAHLRSTENTAHIIGYQERASSDRVLALQEALKVSQAILHGKAMSMEQARSEIETANTIARDASEIASINEDMHKIQHTTKVNQAQANADASILAKETTVNTAETQRDTSSINASLSGLKKDAVDAIMKDESLSTEEKMVKVQRITGATSTKSLSAIKAELGIKKTELEILEKEQVLKETIPVDKYIKDKGGMHNVLEGDEYDLDKDVKISDVQLNVATKIQGKNKVSTLVQTRATELPNVILSIVDTIKYIRDNNIQINAKTKLMDVVTNVIETDDPETRKIKHVYASINTAVANYVKSISGAGVTDGEFQRLKENLIGGDFTNTKALLDKLSEFIKGNKNIIKNTLESVKYETPKFVLDHKRGYQRIVKEIDGIAPFVSVNNNTKKGTSKSSSKYSPEMATLGLTRGDK